MQASDDIRIVPPPLDVSSDSVHCNALTQSSAVSYAFSCHTTDFCCEDNDDVNSSLLALPPPYSKCPSPSWVHVFSKSSSTTSLRTQCAAVAVSHRNVISPKVLHRRSRREQKKNRKIDDLLREVIVPSNHFKLTPEDIDSEIVFLMVVNTQHHQSDHLMTYYGVPFLLIYYMSKTTLIQILV